MDWTNDKSEADAIDRVAELERSFRDGRYRPMSGFLSGFLDFATLGNAHRVGAVRNSLDPGGSLFPETEDEIARVRQHDPLNYYAGMGGNALATAAIFPALAGLQAGAALYNNPAVQRAARDALSSLPGGSLALIGSAPFAVLHAARSALQGKAPTDANRK